MIVLSAADRVEMWWATLGKLLDPRLVPDPGGVMLDPDGARRPASMEELRELAVRRARAAIVAADVLVAEYERRGANAEQSRSERFDEVMRDAHGALARTRDGGP